MQIVTISKCTIIMYTKSKKITIRPVKPISKNNDFTESHTGLEDVLIEKEILVYCFKQHKKMERRLWA